MGLEKLIIQDSEKPDKRLTCLFNPSEYSIAKTNNWKTKDNVGKNVPQVDFTGGGAKSLSMTLFLTCWRRRARTYGSISISSGT